MNYKKINREDFPIESEISSFSTDYGTSEYHVMIHFTNSEISVKQQFEWIESEVHRVESELNAVIVWKRYFLSDAINQVQFISKKENDAAVSIVQQPLLNASKVNLWLYLTDSGELFDCENGVCLKHGAYQHLFHTGMYVEALDEKAQTEGVFHNYIQLLQPFSCTLEKNCVRTWVFVQGVDVHYSGMVAARRACFEKEGLTPQTHFIASTGIEGKHTLPGTLVFMDAYAIQGLLPEQIQHLYASTHLNPTYEYGVTFERGTVVHYGDRKHIFISGTASIDHMGEIVHPLNVIKQTQRIFENIDALLSEAGAGMDHIAHLIVYLRDASDYSLVKSFMKSNYAEIPTMIVWAPVCRPGWLIEVECMAIQAVKNKCFPVF